MSARLQRTINASRVAVILILLIQAFFLALFDDISRCPSSHYKQHSMNIYGVFAAQKNSFDTHRRRDWSPMLFPVYCGTK
mmetsp:Transcript_21661/g.31526  ORF Transcript_21661/g.31526 Transcript_21661/m.31526 type:complete len:80 (+) Transcript_21661:162-401(+)